VFEQTPFCILLAMKQDLIGGAATPIDNCDTIEGITVSKNTETIANITSFNDEATMCAEITANELAYGVSSSANVGDLREYLSRPCFRSSGALPATNTQFALISFANFSGFRDMVAVNTFSRLAGCMGIRATLCFKMVVSATPFHQGIACLSFQYGETNNAINGRRGYFPALAVNLPHVLLDISENTSAELKVPFVAPYEYIPYDDIGNVNLIQPYGVFMGTMLAGARNPTSGLAPTFQIYTWLEDVEVIGAKTSITSAINLQSGGEAKRAGVVSGILDAGSGLVSQVGRIPGLKAAMGTPAWFLKNAANVAASFGFSKPVDTSHHQRVVGETYRYDSQIDVPTPAVVVGPFQTNSITVDGAVGCTDEDQMAFDYILTKKQLICRRELSNSLTTGSYFYGMAVTPSAMWYREGGSGNISLPAFSTLTTSCFLPSTLMYVGSNFRYWRGGFKFTFHFSKTKLHGGRILITYLPGVRQYANTIGSNNVTIPGSVNLDTYSKAFDLKDGNMIDFEVPFTHIYPYANFFDSIGTLSVEVVSDLIIPPNAPSTVDMLVFVEALPGFQFACVKPSMIEGTNPASNQTTTGVYLQSGGVAFDKDMSGHVVGEKFRSVKQLMMVPDWHTQDVANASSPGFSLVPFYKKYYLPIVTGANPIPDTAQAFMYGGKVGRMLDLYAYANGSTVWTITHDQTSASGLTLAAYPLGNDGGQQFGTYEASIYNAASNEDSGFRMFTTDNTLRVVVPSYTKLTRVPQILYNFLIGFARDTFPFITGGSTPNQIGATQQTILRVRNNSGATARFVFGKAAGDDAYVSQFIGPPPCNLFQSTRNINPNPSLATF